LGLVLIKSQKICFMKSILLLSTFLVSSFFISSCKKDDKDLNNSTTASTLRILKSPSGQHQSISANIDNSGYVNFNPQTILADGGSPLHNYTWSIENGTGAPSGITIEPLTGVINRLGHSSTGLSKGTTTFKVKVSDGSASRSEFIDLMVTNLTPGPLAILQQLGYPFQLKNGEVNKVYGASLFCLGGTPPYKWKLDNSYSGSVDLTNSGLTIEPNGGIVSGTILNSAAGKTIKFKVIVTDNVGDVAITSQIYTIVVE
jgi:hypothetical protein